MTVPKSTDYRRRSMGHVISRDEGPSEPQDRSSHHSSLKENRHFHYDSNNRDRPSRDDMVKRASMASGDHHRSMNQDRLPNFHIGSQDRLPRYETDRVYLGSEQQDQSLAYSYHQADYHSGPVGHRASFHEGPRTGQALAHISARERYDDLDQGDYWKHEDEDAPSARLPQVPQASTQQLQSPLTRDRRSYRKVLDIQNIIRFLFT